MFEQGKTLPDRLGTFPPSLYGKPIEDLDDFYDDKYVNMHRCCMLSSRIDQKLKAPILFRSSALATGACGNVASFVCFLWLRHFLKTDRRISCRSTFCVCFFSAQ